MGKPINLFSLKSDIIEKFKEKLVINKKIRDKLYSKNLEEVSRCPICEGSQFNPVLSLDITEYIQCKECTHVFVNKRPTLKVFKEFYSTNETYQKTYTDKKNAMLRVEQVAMPKLKWAIREFQREYKRQPNSILDVGAGSGHFIYACRKMGYRANGIEISKTGCQFAKDIFDVELINQDILQCLEFQEKYDLITFWGVIEHYNYPIMLLRRATSLLNKKGMIIVEVPRWNCLSTAVQQLFSDSIIRHLDPLGHLHVFTDSSLATAFEKCNLNIVGAWYFGMDCYELILQLSNFFNAKELLKQDITREKLVPYLQEKADMVKFSDEIVLSGKLSR